jgi:hypothetical protein
MDSYPIYLGSIPTLQTRVRNGNRKYNAVIGSALTNCWDEIGRGE